MANKIIQLKDGTDNLYPISGYTKSYSVYLSANTNVSPFSSFQEVDTSADVSAYGSIRSVLTRGTSTNTVFAKLSSGGTTVQCYGSKVETITLYVTYG